jgi:hypothetical protein
VGGAVLAGALLFAGCGQGGEKEAVRSVSEHFYAAVASKDGRSACSDLDAHTISELEKQEQKPCPEAVLELKLSGSKAAGAAVYVNSARVDLVRGDSVFLGKESDGWKVSAAGCKPTVEDEPYDCAVES